MAILQVKAGLSYWVLEFLRCLHIQGCYRPREKARGPHDKPSQAFIREGQPLQMAMHDDTTWVLW